ncbi:MAG: vWA domain-containing protein [Acidimicrobiales bacterium]
MADQSGGMAGEKMQALNFAIADMLSHLAEWERDQLRARVLVRVLGFATVCQWHLKDPTPVSEIDYRPLQAVHHGWTNMSSAFRQVADAIGPGRLENTALNPAILLVTDGRPTDGPEEFDAGLDTLMSIPAGRFALRLAMAIGRDADLECLERFIGDPQVPVLVAQDTDEIADRLVAVSVAVSHMSEPAADRGTMAAQILRPAAGSASRSSDTDTIV